jgi:hypothetical protein
LRAKKNAAVEASRPVAEQPERREQSASTRQNEPRYTPEAQDCASSRVLSGVINVAASLLIQSLKALPSA